MKKTLRLSLLMGITAMLIILGGAQILAQNEPGAPPPPDGGRGERRFGGDRGQFDPARMQEMMMERIKEQLGATDDEWTVIKPLLAEVMQAQMNQMRGRMGGGMFGRRPGGDDRGGDRGGQISRNPEVASLEQALENEGTATADLQAKLNALREARKKQEAALQAAREKLRAVLTLRQEARLVLMGMLD